MAFIGFVLLYCYAFTSDYYVKVLHQSEPESIDGLIVWAIVLISPTVFRIVAREILERKGSK